MMEKTTRQKIYNLPNDMPACLQDFTWREEQQGENESQKLTFAYATQTNKIIKYKIRPYPNQSETQDIELSYESKQLPCLIAPLMNKVTSKISVTKNHYFFFFESFCIRVKKDLDGFEEFRIIEDIHLTNKFLQKIEKTADLSKIEKTGNRQPTLIAMPVKVSSGFKQASEHQHLICSLKKHQRDPTHKEGYSLHFGWYTASKAVLRPQRYKQILSITASKSREGETYCGYWIARTEIKKDNLLWVLCLRKQREGVETRTCEVDALFINIGLKKVLFRKRGCFQVPEISNRYGALMSLNVLNPLYSPTSSGRGGSGECQGLFLYQNQTTDVKTSLVFMTLDLSARSLNGHVVRGREAIISNQGQNNYFVHADTQEKMKNLLKGSRLEKGDYTLLKLENKLVVLMSRYEHSKSLLPISNLQKFNQLRLVKLNNSDSELDSGKDSLLYLHRLFVDRKPLGMLGLWRRSVEWGVGRPHNIGFDQRRALNLSDFRQLSKFSENELELKTLIKKDLKARDLIYSVLADQSDRFYLYFLKFEKVAENEIDGYKLLDLDGGGSLADSGLIRTTGYTWRSSYDTDVPDLMDDDTEFIKSSLRQFLAVYDAQNQILSTPVPFDLPGYAKFQRLTPSLDLIYKRESPKQLNNPKINTLELVHYEGLKDSFKEVGNPSKAGEEVDEDSSDSSDDFDFGEVVLKNKKNWKEYTGRVLLGFDKNRFFFNTHKFYSTLDFIYEKIDFLDQKRQIMRFDGEKDSMEVDQMPGFNLPPVDRAMTDGSDLKVNWRTDTFYYQTDLKFDQNEQRGEALHQLEHQKSHLFKAEISSTLENIQTKIVVGNLNAKKGSNLVAISSVCHRFFLAYADFDPSSNNFTCWIHSKDFRGDKSVGIQGNFYLVRLHQKEHPEAQNRLIETFWVERKLSNHMYLAGPENCLFWYYPQSILVPLGPNYHYSVDDGRVVYFEKISGYKTGEVKGLGQGPQVGSQIGRVIESEAVAGNGINFYGFNKFLFRKPSWAALAIMKGFYYGQLKIDEVGSEILGGLELRFN